MSMIIVLLTMFASLTTLVTEGVKIILDELKIKYSSNIVATLCGLVIGTVGTLLYCYYKNIPLDTKNMITAILCGLASALGAMVGYDKIIQTLKQLGKE